MKDVRRKLVVFLQFPFKRYRQGRGTLTIIARCPPTVRRQRLAYTYTYNVISVSLAAAVAFLFLNFFFLSLLFFLTFSPSFSPAAAPSPSPRSLHALSPGVNSRARRFNELLRCPYSGRYLRTRTTPSTTKTTTKTMTSLLYKSAHSSSHIYRSIGNYYAAAAVTHVSVTIIINARK